MQLQMLPTYLHTTARFKAVRMSPVRIYDMRLEKEERKKKKEGSAPRMHALHCCGLQGSLVATSARLAWRLILVTVEVVCGPSARVSCCGRQTWDWNTTTQSLPGYLHTCTYLHIGRANPRTRVRHLCCIFAGAILHPITDLKSF